jgi:hypothetical protein
VVNRRSGLMLVVGLLAGYTVAGSSAQAQTESLPFAVGETVMFTFDEHATPAPNLVECPVTEIRGDFVKCGPRSRAAGRDRFERWVTLKYVVQITKNES